jgi:hypothetical protein
MIELTTKDTVAWMSEMVNIRQENDEYPSDGNNLTPVQNSIIAAYAAVNLDWFEGKITNDMLDDAKPGEVAALGEKVWSIYREAMKIDPNSSSLLANM